MITVFGSINVDIVLRVDRLPAAGETVLCPRYATVPGGKGANQALAAARAGATVRMVGRVGHDGFAAPALDLLRAGGVDLSGVAEADSATGCAAVMVDAGGENAIVVASGANADVTAAQLDDAALGPDTLLILQMEVPHAENWAAIARAKRAGARVMLSVAPAAPVPADMLDAVDVLLVNEVEGRMVAAASGMAGLPRDELPQRLAERHDCLCALTLGGAGVLAAAPGRHWRIPALPLDRIVDTTGAGDAFAGCLAAALDGGIETETALRFAATGAGLACTTLGAQTSFADAGTIRRRVKDLPA